MEHVTYSDYETLNDDEIAYQEQFHLGYMAYKNNQGLDMGQCQAWIEGWIDAQIDNE